ncbi:ABC transporter substrate-binding protein [Paenibacillus alginolyticus]|uniref:ABC transporter substrate-binding protein n=1 Tax=Paenibacillus alginolyticus TaxID=59839 RepID=A0ABT4G6H8_9BACL|nr:ABC transporter substrate-binding protein [Paenibacillus alginolyticus]MCY9691784.1 ABC transporter substrate-binding protein [Paenibacillus alginolyticus]MEC0143250.1 ABC transporter substrate-binding protein [Paenibacillus alginolyticus]
MEKKWKKASGLLSVVLATSTLLSACGSSTSDDGNKAATDSAKPANSKPYEITMAYIQLNDMPDTNLVAEAISKITKEKINATVKLVPISISAWTQQMNLMLAGSEKLDLMVSSSIIGNFGSQVAKGQLEPLDDLLKKHGKGLVDTVGMDLINGSKIDGKVYGVPSLRDIGSDNGIIMRKDLVDKYKIDLSKIKTWADLDPVFQTIKDNEPGLAPLVQQTNNNMPGTNMYNSIVDTLGDNLGVLADPGNSTKIVNLFETKEFTDAVALARKWYQAGYILKDIATSQETGVNLVKAGKAFSYTSNMKPGFEQQEKNLSGKDMVAVRLTKPLQTSVSITGFMMSITKNSQDPERAMQFLNMMYTDKDIANLVSLGIEGKHYVKKADNIITLPDGVKQSGYQFNQWEVGNNFLTYVWEGTDPKIWDLTKAHNDKAIKSKAVGFTFNVDPVKTELAAATNVINQYKVGLESGTLDPALTAEFNAKLKTAGLDKIIAEKQKQIDAWAKTAGK